MSVPGQTKAYNEDLRWCMVWQRLINSYTIKEIASNLYVAESTIWRVVDRFERTGTVTPNRATSRALRLHEHDELLLIELVCDMPSIYLQEIQATLFETTDIHSVDFQPRAFDFFHVENGFQQLG